MVIRDCLEADLDAICALINHEIRTGFAHFGTEPLGLEQWIEQWRRDADRYPWLVAHDGKTVVGYAKASPWKARGGYAWTTELGVYVHPDAQGRGIGRRLYEELFPRLRAAGFRTIIAGIALPNEPSVRLHEALGMTHIGTFPKCGFKQGQWVDVGYWTLLFPGTDPPG